MVNEWQKIRRSLVGFARDTGELAYLWIDTLRYGFRRPFEIKSLVSQMEEIGVRSLPIVMISSFFVGMVMAVQVAYSEANFAGRVMVGIGVGVAITKEFGPLLTALLYLPGALAVQSDLTRRDASQLGQDLHRFDEPRRAIRQMAPAPHKVDGVAAGVAVGVTTPPLAAVFGEVDREGGGVLSAVERTGPAPAAAGAFQLRPGPLGQLCEINFLQ